MLEKMNYAGYWPEEETGSSVKEFLISYSDSLQAYYDICDVNEDGKDELLVKAVSNYKIYTYDEESGAAKVLYSAISEEDWNSDYGNKVKVEWTLMKPESYAVYVDTYMSLYKELLQKNLPNDAGIIYMDNAEMTEKLKEKLKDQYSVTFRTGTETDTCEEGILNGAKVFELWLEDGASLSYQKEAEGITMFGVKPGLSEEELQKTISQYGFYKGKYQYKMGKCMMSYAVENGVVKSISMYYGNEYIG